MPLVDLKDVVGQSFDYIVVGGGTAGLVVAARLTEDPSTSVLVLEAGEENINDPLILRTGQYAQQFGKPEYDWAFKTTPQEYANKIQFPWARGKILGGSSAINFTSYNMCTKYDIDVWEKLGNKGWNWDNFSKYVQRSVTYTPPKLSDEEHLKRGTPEDVKKYWGKVIGNGPLQISHPPVRLDIDVKVEETFRNLGIPQAPAPLHGDPNGMFLSPTTIDPVSLLRSYSATAYWAPNAARPNFKLLTGAVAHRILTEDAGGELLITGVEFSHKSSENATYVAKASKELILSAGTLKNPQILELSGIGRSDILDKINVPIKLELDGVGENIQEHFWVGVTFQLKDDVPDDTYDVLRNPEDATKHLELFNSDLTGAYAMGIINIALAPLSTFSDKADAIFANVRKQYEAEFAAGKYPPNIVEQYKILLDKLDRNVPSMELVGVPGFLSFPNPPAPGKKYFTIVAGANQLFSRGTVHTKSSDLNAQPAMNPNYFEQDIDLKTFVEMVKFCRKVGATSPFKEYLGENPIEQNPGPNVQTDEQIAEHLRSWTATTFHTAGSCSMLPKEKNGVVDNKLKVYGTKNLRIADLSVVPLHIGSHPQSVVYGIGEIAADIIKGKF